MAVHEAGHAVAFHRLRQAEVLAGRITAARIGATGGLVAIEEQAGTPTRVGLEARITCRLAGRAAEALVLGAPAPAPGAMPAATWRWRPGSRCSWSCPGASAGA
ncbi:hypothetical protein [Paracoccus sp. PAMC 22219]|uniref:hypothetical protein n=1 Tax=Paracoccus sp. PAMC 22219 TaxID=1569209 RepID=UPI0018CD78F3|nr:hypothetical protein [Paracoccus sp. PAMC 22219]